MDESEHNLRIEKIAEMILSDKISLECQGKFYQIKFPLTLKSKIY